MTLHPKIEKAIEETKAAVMELAEERNRLAAENEKMKGYIASIDSEIEARRAGAGGISDTPIRLLQTFAEWKAAQ
jgi:regulator of replication initiation timing